MALNNSDADEQVRLWADRLDREWLTEEGFFFRVRDGDYDADVVILSLER